MSNFPQNRDDIGVKIFPHDALVKRGDPGYYHYTPAEAKFGDKFGKPVDRSSVSPRVAVMRNDLNQTSPQSHSTSTKVHSNELSPEYTRQEKKQAIEEHLQHHDRLEKLADFNVDLTPSPMVEKELLFESQQQHESHQQPETHHEQQVHESHQQQVHETHREAYEQPEFEAPVPEHIAEYIREVVNHEHEGQHEHSNNEQEHQQPAHERGHVTDDDGYEVVSEMHKQHSYQPELEIGDNNLQHLLKKEYAEELDRREEEHEVENKIRVFEGDDHSREQHEEHQQHKVTFDDHEPVRDVIEHRLEQEARHEHAQHVQNEPPEQHAVPRHDSVDHLSTEHHVQQGIEIFSQQDESHKHQDQHSLQHHAEHHQQKAEAQPHVHRDQHSLQHHVEHHQQKAEGQQQHVHQDQHSLQHHVEHHQQKVEDGEVDPKEHHRELNTVRQMVQTVNEIEQKNKGGKSPVAPVQHQKPVQQQHQQSYVDREPTMELLHERHEVKLNIEVKKPQQQSSAHHETYSEPKIIEVKQQTIHETSRGYDEPQKNTAFVEHKEGLSPSRRIDKERPDLDSPTRIKTDAIIAQLKSVGVDSDGVKTLKDLKEEKKLAQIRKEAEVKAEIERIKREYTAEKFMTAAATHGPKTGVELPEWKRKMNAQKKADEAIKVEEARLWKEFEEWKSGQSPSWIKGVARKSQP
jgi:hypothetical protein